jgi:GNAT superfamily N-acetyltransferase
VSLFVQRLRSAHNREYFSCGEPTLDDWFQKIAGQAEHKHDSARVFVLLDDDIGDGLRPLGYYALKGHAVDFELPPPALTKGQPQNLPIGAVLLARLAVDQEFGRRQLGAMLLGDAVRQVIAADEHVATPLLVVDALHETAANFYLHYGFVPFPGNPLQLGARLKDIRKTFGLDQIR